MSERNLNFDEIINRRNTNCLKYDFAKTRGMPEDVLPLWVADMDFKTSSYVEDELVRRSQNAVFGYSEVKSDYYNAVADWMKKHHKWNTEEDWLIKTPGVVFALAMAVKAYTEKGDKVLIQQPVYYPFSEVIKDNERVVISNNLYLGEDNKYHIDFADFEMKIRDNKIKLFLLCSPHNPVGRVWTAEELTKLGDICLKYGTVIISDEIHNDFVFQGEHHVFPSLKKAYEDISVVCTSPSKTFNLASMLISNIFIPNRQLKHKFKKQVEAAGVSQLGVLGLVACEAAYKYGEEWYQAMYLYVKSNIEYVKEYTDTYLKNVKLICTEGTYLVWLDFRQTGIDAAELDRKIIYDAKIWLDSGKIFGDVGRGFQRINVACPRKTLIEALDRIRRVVS